MYRMCLYGCWWYGSQSHPGLSLGPRCGQMEPTPAGMEVGPSPALRASPLSSPSSPAPLPLTPAILTSPGNVQVHSRTDWFMCSLATGPDTQWVGFGVGSTSCLPVYMHKTLVRSTHFVVILQQYFPKRKPAFICRHVWPHSQKRSLLRCLWGAQLWRRQQPAEGQVLWGAVGCCRAHLRRGEGVLGGSHPMACAARG